MTSGTKFTAYLEFKDNAGMTEVKSFEFTLDDTPPTLNVSQPMDPSGHLGTDTSWPYTALSKVTGTYMIRGAANDDKALRLVDYSLGVTEIAANSGAGTWHSENDADLGNQVINGQNLTWTGGYSWHLDFGNISFLAAGTTPGSLGVPGSAGTNPWVTWVDPANPANGLAANEYNVWRLPVKFRITDVAGNEVIFERAWFVDPDGDKPVVDFLNPQDNAYVDGATEISGAASDNDKVYDIAYRVLADSVSSPGVFTLQELDDNNTGTTYDNQTITAMGTNGWYSAAATVLPANHQSAQISWNFMINSKSQFTKDLLDGEKIQVNGTG
jgi:hypothetical protein